MRTAFLFLVAISGLFLTVQQEEAIHEIRYESFARGYHKTIILRSDSIILQEQNSKTGDMEADRKTTEAEWKQLKQAIPDLPLASIAGLEAPTGKRASDRALHSTLTIKTSRGEYKSPEFDGYSPHKKLVPLVEQIMEIEKNTTLPGHH